MSIQVSTLEIRGNVVLGESYLPQFRDKQQNQPFDGSGLTEEEREKFGYQTGRRVLPYVIQDRYNRERKNLTLKSIEMKNKWIKAIFLPEYGMRLISLYRKDLNRELLFRNPVLQIANIAIRNAWFSGGIEWNIGQLGHTFTTCDNLFAAVCKDSRGHEFLRCYEYERCKGLYWQVDFHLEEDARNLAAYVRIVNPKEEPVPMYWWTNMAVPEEKNIRVFSGNEDVIYIDTSSVSSEGAARKMIHAPMPYLKPVKGKDASYPQNYDFSSEYFFQNQKDPEQTWEAAVYDDGMMFYEYASPRLAYHKMFCWGVHQGGQHWKDFLSDPGKGSYVELQAGLARTQCHGMDMPGKTTWDFVEVFGGAQVDYAKTQGDWSAAQKNVEAMVKQEITAHQVGILESQYRSNADAAITELLHMGSGFGAVEQLRCPGSAPAGMVFPKASIGPREAVWVELLQKHRIEDLEITELPTSYMTDPRYARFLKEAAENGGYTAKNMYGILCYENSRFEEGIQWFQKSLEDRENPLAFRNLFIAYSDTDPELAISYMEKALALIGLHNDRSFEYIEEYVKYLRNQKQYDKLWNYYQGLPRELQEEERILLPVIPAAVEKRAVDFLDKAYQIHFTNVREGERIFTDCYFAYQAMVEARDTGAEYNDALIAKYAKRNQIPRYLDFRQG